VNPSRLKDLKTYTPWKLIQTPKTVVLGGLGNMMGGGGASAMEGMTEEM